jgi:hypothetical protein
MTANPEVVAEVRKAIEHRATWMYLLLTEARERGLDWDDFARDAIRKTGSIHGLGKKAKMEDPGSMEEFQNLFAGEVSRGVFEMEVVKADSESYHLDFGYCPLVAAWEKLGATSEEIEHLCDIAMDGDRGVAGEFPEFEFSLGNTIAAGDHVCQVRFDKKREP